MEIYKILSVYCFWRGPLLYRLEQWTSPRLRVHARFTRPYSYKACMCNILQEGERTDWKVWKCDFREFEALSSLIRTGAGAPFPSLTSI